MPDALVQPDHALPRAVVSRRRVVFLDGMRGIAALYVVFHHGYLESNWQKSGSGIHGGIRPFLVLLEFGRLAVDVFIVLSGTCLMLPLVRRDSKKAPLEIWKFFRRRAWRILPPYYAAVALSLALIACVPQMGIRHGVHWDVTLPAWTTGVLLSHIILIFNLFPAWAYKINHALWSVATESQIYVVFPIVLLPIWRRAGASVTVLISLLFGVAIFYAVPSTRDARPWYLCLFAMGMMSATLAVSADESHAVGIKRVRWGTIAVGLMALAGATTLARALLTKHVWVPDMIVGMGASALILFCFDHCEAQMGNRPIALRILESPFAVWLGIISYSLYLVHPPILALCNIVLGPLGVSADANLGLMLTFGVGISVFLGWLFWLFIERWFIPRTDPRRTEQSADKPGSLLLFPAPTTSKD
jgi:peptidoglycan/LPS O-acetylase OafA/YrhL